MLVLLINIYCHVAWIEENHTSLISLSLCACVRAVCVCVWSITARQDQKRPHGVAWHCETNPVSPIFAMHSTRSIAMSRIQLAVSLCDAMSLNPKTSRRSQKCLCLSFSLSLPFFLYLYLSTSLPLSLCMCAAIK